jgi:DNA replication protein DnaC
LVCGREIILRKCPACEKKEADETAAEKEAFHASVTQHQWADICPPLYRDTDLDQLEIPHHIILDVLGWKEGGLALVGSTGRGKTRLMFQLLRQLHFSGRSVFAISSKQFERHCGLMFGEDQKSRHIIDKCLSIEILFLDDIGKERMTDRVESELYALIEERSAHLQPILWTSNQDSKHLESSMSKDRAEPITRRLKEFSRIIAV